MTMISTGTRRVVTVLAVLLSGLLVPGAANAAPAVAEPPAEPVFIDVVVASGTGCAPGTTSISVLPDNTAFHINYGAFQAIAGGGAPTAESRKSCSLNLRVHAPQGYTYALAQTDFQGYAHVEPGATALLRSQHYYSGGLPTRHSSRSFVGPFDGDWRVTDVIDPAEQVFVPCGEVRNLNITSELRVIAGTATELPSLISMQASDAQFPTLFQFQWLECP